MAKKAEEKEEVKTIVWVFWILFAIVGVGLLFAGIQSSVFGNSIVTSIMLVTIGLVLLFVGLIMVLGKANIIANDLELPKSEKNNLEMNIITKTNIYIVKPITKEEQYICFLFSIKEK